LHQPANLAAVRRVAHSHAGLAQVGCFDTAFHRSISPLQQRYGLPDALYAAGIRRYGFHGLSYQHIATVLPSYDPAAAAGNTIVLHLGNGCSLSALQQGRSVACSMGFSTLDGVPMATRCGALDPGVVLHLIQQRGLSPAAVEQMLYRESGWLGISGVSADMRVLLASEDAGARTAIDHFVAALVREIGALAAGLGGLDALVFTAGVGENAAPIRAQVLQRLQWLGVEPDSAANAGHGPRITRAGSPISAWVTPTDEERVIATQTLQVLGSARLS
jgi:acetate kinase